MSEKVHCKCGRVLGEMCEWVGPIEETVIVEHMPYHLRDQHSTCGNSGTYPHNGAVRIRVERSCAERLCKDDEEWTWIVENKD